jgi:uncharacterized protein (DUF2141 family)
VSLLALALLVTAADPLAPAANAPGLTVEVSGLRSDNGKIRIFVFATEDGFPEVEKKAVAHVILPIHDRKATARLALAPGTYAIATCHDENGNNVCDGNFLGIPVEGIGCSNFAHKAWFKPSFKDAKLTYDGKTLAVPIRDFRY